MSKVLRLLGVALLFILGGSAYAAPMLTASEIIGGIANQYSNDHPGQPFGKVADKSQFSFTFKKDGYDFTVGVNGAQFVSRLLQGYGAYRAANNITGCNKVDAGLGYCNGWAAQYGYYGYQSYHTGGKKTPYNETLGIRGILSGTDWRNYYQNPSEGNLPPAFTGSYYPRVDYPAITDTYGDQEKLAVNAYISQVSSKFYQGLNVDAPTVSSLINNYGVTIDGVTYVDKGYGTGFDNDGTPLTPPPPAGPDCTANPSLPSCAPSDESTNCTILDIPCNFRKLFIPKPDYFKKTFSSQGLSDSLNLPVKNMNEINFKLCFLTQTRMVGNNAENDNDCQPFIFYFTDYITPIKNTGIDVDNTGPSGQEFLNGLADFALFFWALNMFGIPHPFSRSAHGAGAVGEAVRQTRALQERQRLKELGEGP